MLEGSDPTPGSVRAKALISPPARRGKNFCFCSSVPAIFTGWGTPMLWWAERVTAVEAQWLATNWMIRL